jgi:hypothetical protein
MAASATRPAPSRAPEAGTASRVPGDRRTALLVALATLAAAVVLNFPFIASYHTTGDTAALVLHSTRFFPVSPAEWMTEGFSRYFVNFPEATREYTAFVRPTVNLSFWLESLLAPSPHSRVFLLTNYLGHALCAALVFLVARRIGGVGTRRAVLAAGLFAGTVAALELFHSPAFRADMLGALLGTAALLSVDSHLRADSRRHLAMAVVLLSLAVLAKETAAAAPVICAGWAMWRAGEDGRRRPWGLAILLLSPLALLVAARLAAPEAGVYAGLHPRNAVQTLSSAFFPGGGALEAMAILRGRMVAGDALRAASAWALNLAALALVASALVRRRGERERRIAALAAMALLALTVPAALAAFPRLMYFGQVFALPLLAAVLPSPRGRGGLVTLSLVVLALLAGPAWVVVRMSAMQGGLEALNRDGRATRAAAVRALRDPSIERLYLVNDVAGTYGAHALLQLAAAEAGRGGVALRVTNSMGRLAPGGARGTTRVFRSGGDLRVVMTCGAGCDFSFPGVLPEDRARLGIPGVIHYERVANRELVFTIPNAARGDAALVVLDPALPGARVFRW